MRVPYDVMKAEFLRVLHKYGITGERAELSATLFVNASRDGIYTHGLNRFPKFIKALKTARWTLPPRRSASSPSACWSAGTGTAAPAT